MQNLGSKIRAAREDAKMSQLQLGVALKVSDKTISGYESERICPPIDKLQQMSELFKIPVSYFVEHDERGYRIAARLTAIENMLREIRKELRTIKLLSKQTDSD